MIEFLKRILYNIRVWSRYKRLQEFKWRQEDPIGFWQYQDRLWSD